MVRVVVRVVGVLCVEVGGINSLEPLLVSGKIGLPAVDADGMGRAFPMLHVGGSVLSDALVDLPVTFISQLFV